MTEIAVAVVGQLVGEYGCAWASLFLESADERTLIATAGETGTPPDDSVAVSRDGSELVLEFAFRQRVDETVRQEAKLLATSLVNGIAQQRGWV